MEQSPNILFSGLSTATKWPIHGQSTGDPLTKIAYGAKVRTLHVLLQVCLHLVLSGRNTTEPYFSQNPNKCILGYALIKGSP